MAAAPTNWIRLTGDGEPLTFAFSSRDWKVLSNMHDPAARHWLGAFGFSSGGSSSSVAAGLQIGYEAAGDRQTMQQTTEALMSRLRSEEELLMYDYSVKIAPGLGGRPPDCSYSGGRISSFKLGEKHFSLSLRPGRCHLEESTATQPLVIDLRTRRTFEADGPVSIAISRRKKGLAWPSVLPQVLSFLEHQRSKTISIVNHHR